jgi:lysophospholipase L1-like esterase
MGWYVENRGVAGMSAGRLVRRDGRERILSATGDPGHAGFHLERLLAEDRLATICRWLPASALAPRLVIAVGTNDVGTHPVWVVLDDILALQRRAEEVAPCVRVYVATIPPQFHFGWKHEAQRVLLNGLMRARVPADRLVEFDQGFVRGDFNPDGIHANLYGQRKRAEAALRVLFPQLAG